MDLVGDRVIARPCGTGRAMASSGASIDAPRVQPGSRPRAWRRANSHGSDPGNHGGVGGRWCRGVGDAGRGESTKRGLEACRDLAMRPGERFLRFLDNRRQTFLIVSLFLILVGARAVVINYAGNPTPYADEWDGEAANLLKPYLEGALTIRRPVSCSQ